MVTQRLQEVIQCNLLPAYLKQSVHQNADHASQKAVGSKLQAYPGPVGISKNTDIAQVANRGIVPVGRQTVRMEVLKL